MEAIVFDVNPSLKQLTENMQRMSDHMQRMQQKEMKKLKVRRTTEIDHADISTETELMRDDLMGSMDPDQFRGGRSSKAYLDYRRFGHQDSAGQSKVQTSKGDDGLAESTIGKITDMGGLQNQGSMVKSTDKIGYIQERAPLLPYKASMDGNDKKELPFDEKDGKKKTPVIMGKERVEISPPLKQIERRQTEKRESPKEQKKEKPVRQAVPTSLLAIDEGFIIADPQKQKQADDQEQEVSVEFESIDLTLDEDESNEDISIDEIIDDMILTPLDQELQEQVRRIIAPFGNRILRICRDFNCKIVILSQDEKISSILPDEMNKDSYSKIRAAYLPELRLCVFGEEFLQNDRALFNIPRFYFSHCFDNALGKDDFASLKSAAVLSNFKACILKEPGHQFIDGFSALSPVHYFAQAVESYLSEEKEGEILCGREQLYDIDRSMFLYVEYLFSVINKEPPKRFQTRE